MSEDNELRIVYEAETDADTPVSLTNHSYFNLNGGGSVLSQLLTVSADKADFLKADAFVDLQILGTNGKLPPKQQKVHTNLRMHRNAKQLALMY